MQKRESRSEPSQDIYVHKIKICMISHFCYNVTWLRVKYRGNPAGLYTQKIHANALKFMDTFA